IGGQIQVMFGSVVTRIEQIKSGKVRALAVTSAARTQLLPDLPPVGEFVPGYEGTGWQGIGAPKNTPADIIDKLNTEINVGLVDPKLKSPSALPKNARQPKRQGGHHHQQRDQNKVRNQERQRAHVDAHHRDLGMLRL